MTKKSKEELREEFLKEFSYKSRLAHSSSVSMYYSAKSPEEAATWWIAKVEAAEAAAEERKVREVRAEIFRIERAPEDWTLDCKMGYARMRTLAADVPSLTLPTKSEDHE